MLLSEGLVEGVAAGGVGMALSGLLVVGVSVLVDWSELIVAVGAIAFWAEELVDPSEVDGAKISVFALSFTLFTWLPKAIRTEIPTIAKYRIEKAVMT